MQNKHEWLLENIMKNPGEFFVEMRQAASEILTNRRRYQDQQKIGDLSQTGCIFAW